MNRPATSPLLVLILGSSGFASLIYEILWVRYFSYLLGGTVISLSMVSAVFLGGLAIGYRYLGRLGDSHTRPLKLYVQLEVGIALCSLLPITTNHFLTGFVDPVFLSLSSTPALLHTTQFLLVCLLVLPSTICMGATVPVLLGSFRESPLASTLANYYFINTLGGALGVFTAVFLLLPKIGATNSHMTAMATSFLSALLAFVLSRRQQLSVSSVKPTDNKRMKLERPLAVLTFICGFFILATEVLWSRLLMLYLGNTIFSFGIILGIVLVSIAAGSRLYPLLPKPKIHSWRFASLLIAIMGLSVALPALYYDQAAHLFYAINIFSKNSWSLLVVLQLGAVLLIAGLPTFCSGLFFPLIAGLSTPPGGCRSQLAGHVGFWNTLGTICGSLAAAFLLLPLFGLKQGFLLLSTAFLPIGLAVCCQRSLQQNRTSTIRLMIVLCLLIALPWFFNRQWDAKLIHSGVYLYSPYYEEIGGLKRGLGEFRLIFSRHDRESSVAITENRLGSRSLVINGKVDASSGQDMATQYLLAHLPMLHHPNPKKVMVIGLGSGVTLGSASLYAAEQLDSLEISPAVVNASDYFADFNLNVLADPRTKVKIADGMYSLRTRGERYDVVISEPSNPWQQGNASLFSRNFYNHVRERLNPKGIFCQWIPLYDLSPQHLKSALATFHEAFPHSLLFLNRGDLLVLGSHSEIQKLTRLKSFQPQISEQMTAVGVQNPSKLYQEKLLYDNEKITPWLKEASINTLDLSELEFAAKPLFTSGFVGPFGKANREWLRSLK